MYLTHIVMLYYDSCKNHTFTNIIDCKIFCLKQGYIVFYLYLCNVYRRDCCLNLQHPGMQSLHIHFLSDPAPPTSTNQNILIAQNF